MFQHNSQVNCLKLCLNMHMVYMDRSCLLYSKTLKGNTIYVHNIFFSCLHTGIWMHTYAHVFYVGIRIITAASAVEKERSRRLTTSILNQVVQEALAFKSPPRTRGGKRGRVYYCTQVFISKADPFISSTIYSFWFRMKFR